MTLDGSIAGSGHAPGANRNSGGDTAGSLETALRQALSDLDPSDIAAGVFGIAGAGSAGRPAAVAAAGQAWSNCGIAGAPTVVTDIAVAFASGTTAPSGIVVFAGTGAGAAAISDGEIIRRADGYGWLVGDEGSAVWIGKEAVRAALHAYDGRGRPTLLAESVPRALFGTHFDPALVPSWSVPELELVGGQHGVALGARPPTPMAAKNKLTQHMVKEVYAMRPAAFGRLGPVVCSAAMAGDAVARRITEEAAEWLLLDVDAVREAADVSSPVVMAGSVLATGPVGDLVRAGLRARFAAEPTVAGEGAVGAAAMALRAIRI